MKKKFAYRVIFLPNDQIVVVTKNFFSTKRHWCLINSITLLNQNFYSYTDNYVNFTFFSDSQVSEFLDSFSSSLRISLPFE